MTTNKKQTIAYWARLLITYSSEIIPLNSHTSLRSPKFKNSCFVFHQGFQTPRNNKSTTPIRFSVFGTPDENLALVFYLLHEIQCRMPDINSQTKWFYKEKLRMQKWVVFHLICKHSLNINFLCIFLWIKWILELLIKSFRMV